MTDANLFQEFAEEALQRASKAKSEQEKLALNELALAWVNAALASDRVFGSSWYFPWSSRPHWCGSGHWRLNAWRSRVVSPQVAILYLFGCLAAADQVKAASGINEIKTNLVLAIECVHECRFSSGPVPASIRLVPWASIAWPSTRAAYPAFFDSETASDGTLNMRMLCTDPEEKQPSMYGAHLKLQPGKKIELIMEPMDQ
jgi:hypothetical protein